MKEKVKKLLEEIQENSDKEVIVYSMVGCPACNELKTKLESIGITYENVEMAGNEDMWAVLKKEGGKDYVPQVRVDNKLIHEFDEINDLVGIILTEIVGRRIIIK